MLDCMHKFRARSHKISTPCIISTPSSRYGFSHDLLVFFFDVHVENTGMTLAFRLAWSVLCCGHENRVRTRVTRGSGQPKKKNLGEGFFGARGPGNLEFFLVSPYLAMFFAFPLILTALLDLKSLIKRAHEGSYSSGLIGDMEEAIAEADRCSLVATQLVSVRPRTR